MNRLMSALFRSIRILSAHLAGARRNAILAFAVTLAGTASFFLGSENRTSMRGIFVLVQISF